MKEKTLVLDNYDSFTYNLVQYLQELGATVEVARNDEIDVGELKELSPTHLVISPGPGRPEDAGVCCRVVEALAGEIPILGVCLGHQVIGQVMGARVVRGAHPVHGKTSLISHDSRTIYQGLSNPFRATRYHSLVVDRAGLPHCLEITSVSEDGLVMGIRHREMPLEGVQFHPESILTENGHGILSNFLKMGARGA